MALTAGQINVGNYPQPDYSGVVRSAQSAAAQGAENISQAIGVVTDYAKEQKALAQKDKEMAAKIKGTISLLDNAKALYPDFAERIDATKLQLSDPSLSNLDKLGIAGNVEGSLNMMVTKGSDVMKNRLMEAQIGNYETQSRTAGQTLQEQVITDPVTGEQRLVTGRYDLPSNTFTPGAVADGQQAKFRSTAFGRSSIDQTTKNEIESGQFKKMNGDENVGSGGIPYAGPSSQTPTIATKAYPAGTRLIITSDLYPQGREHIVAGTGPADPNALDFFADTKEEYNKLADQNIRNVQVVDGRSQAILNASQIPTPSLSRISSDFLAQAGYPSGDQSQAVSQPVAVPQAQAAQPQAQAPVQPAGQFSRMVMPAPKRFVPESPEAQESRKLRDAQARAEIALTNQKLAEAKGTQEQKTQAVQEAKMANDRAKREALTIVKSATSLTNEILKNIPEDNTASTVWRALGPEVLARNQKKLSNALKPIEAQVMLRTLNSLREASTTGGSGLGPLSDKEGALLMSSIASLDAYADPTDIRRSLKSINDHFINAEFGDREERIQLVKENKMTIPKFNEIESKYSSSKPLKLPDIPLTNRTPAQEEALNKHLQSR